MTVRDRVVLWLLATGFVAALLAWHSVGPWLALAVGVIALALTGVVYRIEPPRIDLDRPDEGESHPAEEARRVDQ